MQHFVKKKTQDAIVNRTIAKHTSSFNKVLSEWLPSYIKTVQWALGMFKIIEYFPDWLYDFIF